jgi:hypothetical protein
MAYLQKAKAHAGADAALNAEIDKNIAALTKLSAPKQ